MSLLVSGPILLIAAGIWSGISRMRHRRDPGPDVARRYDPSASAAWLKLTGGTWKT